MPNLNAESKLITPGQALAFLIFASVFAIWYWEIDVLEHLSNIKESVHYVTGGIL